MNIQPTKDNKVRIILQALYNIETLDQVEKIMGENVGIKRDYNMYMRSPTPYVNDSYELSLKILGLREARKLKEGEE